MATTELTGTLKGARLLLDDAPRCPCLYGRVYGDSKGRFRDGEYIYTSRLKLHEDGGIFRTTYSVYKVESWA